jgi:hypothetical protein
MTKRSGGLAAIAAGVALMLAGNARGATVVLPRPGQVGIAGLAQYGTLFKRGDIGEDFRSGPGFGVRLRYRMRYERGLGLTFERQGFDPRVKSAADTAARKLTVMASAFEVYQMFGTRTRTVKMLSVGAGLAQATQKLNDNETKLSGEGTGDGLFVSLGGEIEYFFWQTWAMDLSVRYAAVLLNQTTNHDVQVAAGLIFYAGY